MEKNCATDSRKNKDGGFPALQYLGRALCVSRQCVLMPDGEQLTTKHDEKSYLKTVATVRVGTISGVN